MKFEVKPNETISKFIDGYIMKLPPLSPRVAKAIEENKVLSVNVDIKRKRRSLDANAYLWSVLGQMAEALDTDKDSVYLQELEKYGVVKWQKEE